MRGESVGLEEPAEGERPLVLVVDDLPTNLRVAVWMLERLGCVVETAAGGIEAVALVASRPYRIVFMDCMMPDMDGFEATRAIRAMPGGVGELPIVALTANALQADAQRCLAAGMNDHLAKPVLLEGIRAMMARWVPDAVLIA